MRKRETKAAKEARHRFYEAVLLHRPCWFRPIVAHECDGPLDPCHLLPKQRLKNIAKDRGYDEAQTLDMVWDARNGVPGCRAIHHKFDNGFITLTWEQLPVEAVSFAFGWGLEWEMEQMFGKEVAA